MQEKYTLNTALAAVVGLGCLAAVLYRVFLPAAVLPAVGLPAAAACSPGPPGSPPGQRPCALPWWAARPSAL